MKKGMVNKKSHSQPSQTELKRLIHGEHSDPHSILGAHSFPEKNGQAVIIRAFHPEAVAMEICLDNENPLPMERIHPGGIFATKVKGKIWPFYYRLRFKFADGKIQENVDPYRFLPALGEKDLYLFGEGTHQRIYERLGAHPKEMDGIPGVSFAVWAPNAKGVSLIGDFNNWDGRLHPLRSLGASGIWEIFIPGMKSGDLYKYEIRADDGRHLGPSTL